MDREFTHKVVKNTVATLYARLWILAVGVVLTPYILSRLGNEEFGIWVLITVLVAHLGLLDFGVGTSFVKYIAEYEARCDRESVNGVFSTGLVVNIAVAVFIVVPAYLSTNFILRFFSIPATLHVQTQVAFNLGIVAFLVGSVVGAYQSVIIGLQRMDVSNAIMTFLSVCSAAGSIVVLELGFGLAGLAVNLIVTQTIGALVTITLAYRISPLLRFNLKMVKQHFPRLLRYGLNLQISSLAVFINFQFDKLLILRYIDASYTTFYEIGSRMPAVARSFPQFLLSTLVPASSELEVRKGRAELYDLFWKASKYVSVMAFPLLIGAMVTGEPFIKAWVGDGYDVSVAVLRILCIGYLFNIIAGPVSPLVQGMGRPDYQRNAEALSLLLNVTISLFLIKEYGFYGAPVGTIVAMSAAAFYYLWTFHRFTDRPLLPFLTGVLLKPALFAVSAGLLGFAVTTILLPYASSGRLAALGVLLVAGLIFVGCYIVLILKCSYFDDRDLGLLREHLPLGSA